MASTYLTRTAGTPTLNTKYTISFWVKRHKLTYSECFLFDAREDGNNRFKLSFQSADKIECFNSHGGSDTFTFVTNRMFRDTSAWYHIVLAVDTTQSGGSDRVKLYVNGTQEESFASYSDATQNDANNVINENSRALTIGAYNSGSSYSNHADVSLTHIHFVDGTAYTPSTFGETDSTSGIWKPKTSPSVTYGNNGYFLKFENSGAMGTDSSGNTNTFTPAGTLTQNVDTPSNVFATWNALSSSSGYAGQNAPTNGNTTFVSGETGTNYPTYFSTLGVSSGKWYFECKMGSSGGAGAMIGIADQTKLSSYLGSGSQDYAYFGDNGKKYVKGASGATYGNSFGNNDIVGVALDLDNNKLYFSKNGTFQDSGVPTSGSTGTGAISIDAPSATNTGFYFFAAGDAGNSDAPTVNANFGSGFFGTTAVASANADGNGIGAFEYTVPTGYYALCTKNIKEFG